MKTAALLRETRFVRACRGEPVDRIPVWMMRQAGRYMPEYQALRKDASFLELCQKPKLAAQATLDAARFLDTDAAIIFSDITIPVIAMGQGLRFEPGPILEPPIRSRADVSRLRRIEPARDLGYVLEAIRLTRSELPQDVSLIGFVGAPLTLAAYMVEGTPGRGWTAFKSLLYSDPTTFEELLDRVTEAVAAHAAAQIEAGCDTVQLFDSLAGDIASAELQRFAFGAAQKVIAALRPLGAPIIYFARNIGGHLEQAATLGADVLGLDWTVSVTEARRRLGDGVRLMGNLDPSVLLTTPTEVDRRTRAILDEARGLPGFVFNLGHGILPPTPPSHAKQVVGSVRAWCRENMS